MEAIAANIIDAVLTGMTSLGLDVAAIRARAGLAPGIPSPGARWPREALTIAWMQGLVQFGNLDLAAEVGLRVPYGAFGQIDYLIASSETMGGGLHALAAHYQGGLVTPTITLAEEDGEVRLEVRPAPSPMPSIGEEFSLALTLKNLRYISAAPLPLTEVCVTRADPGSSALASLFGAPVRFGAPLGALRFAASVMDLPLRTADPYLHRVVDALATSLELGDAPDPFFRAIRARLREALPRGEPEAAATARTLGMSERTLHRRLRERGATWRAVIDAFRRDESIRLLREKRSSLAEVALTLGFSDQTAWTRAFRRWTGQSPTRWAREVG